MELHLLSDRIARKIGLEAVFKVVIPERDAWNNIPAEQEALLFYTWLKKRRYRGMGICGPSLTHFEALHR
jgi:hypothetical protein